MTKVRGVADDTREQAFFFLPGALGAAGQALRTLCVSLVDSGAPVTVLYELSRPEGRDHPMPRHPLTRSGAPYARGD